VEAAVMPEGSPALLGFPVLNEIAKLTIDASAGRVTFNA
jgi:hypothetical protein